MFTVYAIYKGYCAKTDLALETALGERSCSVYGWIERDMGWNYKTEKEFNDAVERLKKFREHQIIANDSNLIQIAHTVTSTAAWRELQDDNTWKDKQHEN